jgi:hypothetical protein
MQSSLSLQVKVKVVAQLSLDSRVLRRISEPKRDEGWRKLNNEKLYNLYSSTSIVRMIKLRMMR